MEQVTSARCHAYRLAQEAFADLKTAVLMLLEVAPGAGLTNSAIGRSLGIYHGHVGHEGHIPRTLLAMMEAEGVVAQLPDGKRWVVRTHTASASENTPDFDKDPQDSSPR